MAATILLVQRMSKGDQNKVKPIVEMNKVKKTHNARVKACSHQEQNKNVSHVIIQHTL